jgi:hypothetical protein
MKFFAPKQQLTTFSIPFTIVNGAGESTTNTSYDDMAYYKVPFDKTMFPNAVSIKLQVLLQQDNSGTYQVWCQLKTTAGSIMTGSEVTATLAQYATSVQTSGDLTSVLTNGPESYQLQGKTASGGKCDIQGAAIMVQMAI